MTGPDVVEVVDRALRTVREVLDAEEETERRMAGLAREAYRAAVRELDHAEYALARADALMRAVLPPGELVTRDLQPTRDKGPEATDAASAPVTGGSSPSEG